MHVDRATMESLSEKLHVFGESLTEPEQGLLADLLEKTRGGSTDVEGFALGSSDTGASAAGFSFFDVFADVAVRRDAALIPNGKRGWYYPYRQRSTGTA